MLKNEKEQIPYIKVIKKKQQLKDDVRIRIPGWERGEVILFLSQKK